MVNFTDLIDDFYLFSVISESILLIFAENGLDNTRLVDGCLKKCVKNVGLLILILVYLIVEPYVKCYNNKRL